MKAKGNTKKSKVSPVTPISRVDLKNRHNPPMTSRIKNDMNNSISNSRFRNKKTNKPKKFWAGTV